MDPGRRALRVARRRSAVTTRFDRRGKAQPVQQHIEQVLHEDLAGAQHLSTAARTERAPTCRELPDAKWTGDLNRTLHLDTLFANHAILRTGRLTIE